MVDQLGSMGGDFDLAALPPLNCALIDAKMLGKVGLALLEAGRGF